MSMKTRTRRKKVKSSLFFLVPHSNLKRTFLLENVPKGRVAAGAAFRNKAQLQNGFGTKFGGKVVHETKDS